MRLYGEWPCAIPVSKQTGKTDKRSWLQDEAFLMAALMNGAYRSARRSTVNSATDMQSSAL
jgi:hypothetical protein